MALVARPDAHARTGASTNRARCRRPPRTTWTGLRRPKMLLILLGLFGAALLYGDGVITPAISVLSAVEGLEVATSALANYVVPITCLILVRAVRGPEAGNRRHRHDLRPGHGALVHRHLGARAALGDAPPADPAGHQPPLRGPVLRGPRAPRVPGAGRRRAVRDRRRGPLRRHGALRDARDPHRLVHLRLPGAAHQLLRAGGDAARAPGGRREPVLRARPRGLALSRWWCSRRSRRWWRRRR